MGFESFPQLQPAVSPERKDLVRKYVESESQRVDDATQRRLGSEHLEHARLNRERILHNGLDIDFIGVAHEPETLLKYREEIEKAIEAADFVVIEATLNVGSEGVASTAELAEHRAGTTANDVFFGEIENAARKYGKKIISMDAFTSARNLSESGKSPASAAHLRESDRLQDGHRGAAAAGVVAAGAIAWMQRGNEKTTRRAFLKGAAYAGGTLAGVDGLLNGTDVGYNNTQLRMPLHSGQDYRDVILAEGIDFLSQKFSKRMKVAMVYGAAHAIGFRSYLESPNIRKAKRKTYRGLDEIDSPEIRGYAFHEGGTQDRSEWQETFRVKI